MANLEQIKNQLEWGKENLDSPQDNLSLEDVEWLIEQAEKVEFLEKRYEEILVQSTNRLEKLIEIQHILDK